MWLGVMCGDRTHCRCALGGEPGEPRGGGRRGWRRDDVSGGVDEVGGVAEVVRRDWWWRCRGCGEVGVDLGGYGGVSHGWGAAEVWAFARGFGRSLVHEAMIGDGGGVAQNGVTVSGSRIRLLAKTLRGYCGDTLVIVY